MRRLDAGRAVAAIKGGTFAIRLVYLEKEKLLRMIPSGYKQPEMPKMPSGDQ